MRKSRALLLFGTLFLLIAGYVAWCGRAFYSQIDVPDLSSWPETRPLILSGIDASGMREPEIFSFRRLGELMMHPYEPSQPSIGVREDGGATMLTCVRFDAGKAFYLVKDHDGVWKKGPVDPPDFK